MARKKRTDREHKPAVKTKSDRALDTAASSIAIQNAIDSVSAVFETQSKALEAKKKAFDEEKKAMLSAIEAKKARRRLLKMTEEL